MTTKIRVKKKKLPSAVIQKRKEANERHQQALDLRKTGATYQQIAEALGYAGAGAAKKAVDSAIARTEVEAAKEVVDLDLARLDEYQMRCTAALRNNGDLSQIDRLMRIMEMRYRLLGISPGDQEALRQQHGINITNNHVMQVMPAPETQQEFIEKMMEAVGVDPSSRKAQAYLEERAIEGGASNPLPIAGVVEEEEFKGSTELPESEIVDAELVEDE